MFSLISLCVLIFSSGTVESKLLNSRLKSIAVLLLHHQCYVTADVRMYRPEERSAVREHYKELIELIHAQVFVDTHTPTGIIWTHYITKTMR